MSETAPDPAPPGSPAAATSEPPSDPAAPARPPGALGAGGPPGTLGPGGPPGPPGSLQFASLYVGDLHPDISEAVLYESFCSAGSIASCRICRDGVTRKSLGYGYVNYYNVEDAEKALETLNYQRIKGRSCRVMWSQRDAACRKEATGNVFVKNLDESIDNKALHDTFGIFGHILSCKVATDKDGKSKGYGFVHYEAEEAAKQAIERVNGMQIGDTQVFVGPFFKRSELESSDPEHFTNLYAKNLPEAWDEGTLTKAFAEYGEVVSSVIMQNVDGKRFALINYRDTNAAQAAIEALHRKPLTVFGDAPPPSDDAKLTALAEVSEAARKEEAGAGGEATAVDDVTKAEADDKAAAAVAELKAVEAELEAVEENFPANLLYVQRAQTRAQRREQIMKERISKRGAGGQRGGPPGARLCVRNLSEDMTDATLREIFEPHGTVVSTLVKLDEDGLCRGLAFVVMSSTEEATKATAEVHLSVVGGKPLNVGLADKGRALRLGQIGGGEGDPGSPNAGERSGKGKGGKDGKGKGKGKRDGKGKDGKAKGEDGKGKGKGNKRGGFASMLPGGPRPTGPFPYALPPGILHGMMPPGMPGMPGALPPGYPGRPPFPGSPQQSTYSLPPAMSAGRPSMPSAGPNWPLSMPMPGMPAAPYPYMSLGARPPGPYPPMPVPGLPPNLEAMLRANAAQAAAFPGAPMNPLLSIGRPPMPMPPSPSAHDRPQLSREVLSQLPPQAQKQQLGERLYSTISRHRPDLAGKVTGMMLELDNNEIMKMLENDRMLKKKIDEAVVVLERQR